MHHVESPHVESPHVESPHVESTPTVRPAWERWVSIVGSLGLIAVFAVVVVVTRRDREPEPDAPARDGSESVEIDRYLDDRYRRAYAHDLGFLTEGDFGLHSAQLLRSFDRMIELGYIRSRSKTSFERFDHVHLLMASHALQPTDLESERARWWLRTYPRGDDPRLGAESRMEFHPSGAFDDDAQQRVLNEFQRIAEELIEPATLAVDECREAWESLARASPDGIPESEADGDDDPVAHGVESAAYVGIVDDGYGHYRVMARVFRDPEETGSRPDSLVIRISFTFFGPNEPLPDHDITS